MFMGNYNMFGLAKRTHTRFLITSTSEVYSDPLVHPQVADYQGNVNPIGECSCYNEGKHVAETLCYDFKRQNGVDIRIARIFNTYGQRMALNGGRFVSNFVGQAVRGEKLTIQGSGNQTQSFCYMSDQIEGLIKLINTENVEGPVNIGNPTEFTIRELADVVKPSLDVTYRHAATSTHHESPPLSRQRQNYSLLTDREKSMVTKRSSMRASNILKWALAHGLSVLIHVNPPDQKF